MANAIYPKYKTNLLKGTSGYDLDAAEGATGVFVALVDTGTYTYSAAHEFYSDLSGIGGTPMEITTKTVGTVAEAVFDGDNITFSAVAGTVTYEALVLYRKNAGDDTTWPLIAYIDTSVTGLPVTSNGGDITVTWNASGIFKL
jgi:hypothetical protein